MLKKLQIGQIMDSLWLILVCLALGGFMSWKMGPALVTLVKGVQPLTAEKELSEMEGKYVSWNVKYPIDEYLETTRTTKVNGVSTGTRKHRSSWLVIDEDREICLSIEVPVKRFDEMLAQSDKFFDAIDTEAFVVEGGVDVGAVKVLGGLLQEDREFHRLRSLYGRLAQIYPLENWQEKEIECLMSMNQHQEACQPFCNSKAFITLFLFIAMSTLLIPTLVGMSSFVIVLEIFAKKVLSAR